MSERGPAAAQALSLRRKRKRKRSVPTRLERAGSVTCADGFYRCQPVMPLRRVIRTAVVQCLSPAEDVDRVAVALTAAALPKLSEEEPHGCKRFLLRQPEATLPHPLRH